MQTLIRCGIALICAALGGNVQAAAANEAAQKKTNPHFARLDLDKDGFLSYREARADREAARNFALFDENRDGRLSEDEYLKLKATLARHRGGVYVSDSAITSKVKLALLKAKDLKSADVHVETTAGVVKLSGEVDKPSQSARAGELAGRIRGVKKVENRLAVRPIRQ